MAPQNDLTIVINTASIAARAEAAFKASQQADMPAAEATCPNLPARKMLVALVGLISVLAGIVSLEGSRLAVSGDHYEWLVYKRLELRAGESLSVFGMVALIAFSLFLLGCEFRLFKTKGGLLPKPVTNGLAAA